jgi:hypothetical protein
MSAHETFRPMHVRPSSDRSFGLVFATFFALVGLLPLWSGRPLRSWALALSAAFLVTAFVKPAVLAPLNRAWTALGHLLSKVTTPIVLGVLFYGVFTPYGWVMRRLGRVHVALDFDRGAASYWIPRDPPGPSPESMSSQF